MSPAVLEIRFVVQELWIQSSKMEMLRLDTTMMMLTKQRCHDLQATTVSGDGLLKLSSGCAEETLCIPLP